MEMTVTFPGGKKVNAEYNGVVIPTDQPPEGGGEGSAPTPYALFLASIGTCAGIYVLSFCQQRNIPTESMYIRQRMEFVNAVDGKAKLAKIVLEIGIPPEFPEKYRDALVRSAELCAVKKTITNPPEFEVATFLL